MLCAAHQLCRSTVGTGAADVEHKGVGHVGASLSDCRAAMVRGSLYIDARNRRSLTSWARGKAGSR